MSYPNRPTDAEYFAGRAADETARAEACKDPQIAMIHRELAARYDQLAALSKNKPRFQIVGD
ncbi:MAG: hypothetical protein V4530_07045 [Pseudomonadota bacterium]